MGKSRLLTQFTETAGVPYLFTTAVKNAAPSVQLEQITADLWTARAPLPEVASAFAAAPTSWADLLARLPVALGDEPAIVVLDEFPWAAETDDTVEGVLQNAWDRGLEHLPVLLILVGSDLTMMERLTTHDRPLYGRAEEMVVGALSPGELADAFPRDRSAPELLDLYLVTGGYPRLVLEAREQRSVRQFVHAQLADDQSPLAMTGLRILDAEFRADLQARTVLEAIGAVEVGHATFSEAVARLGGAAKDQVALSRALPVLQDKRIVAVDVPAGASETSKLRRYRITDPYLGFWFRYCAPHLDDTARGRPDIAVDRFDRDYESWRGRAIEPVVRDAVFRLGRSDERFADVAAVGAWWDRKGDHEFDVVASTRRGGVAVVGTIKWRRRKAVDRAELETLAEARSKVKRAGGARLLVVCPAGVRAGVEPDILLTAQDVVDAYRPPR